VETKLDLAKAHPPGSKLAKELDAEVLPALSVANVREMLRAAMPLQQRLVNRLAMALFTWIKKNPASGGPGQLMVVDEAKDFVPSKGGVASGASLIRLTAQGRKYGLGLVFATQAPKSINHNVIANCATQVYGRASSPAARDSRDWRRASSTFTPRGCPNPFEFRRPCVFRIIRPMRQPRTRSSRSRNGPGRPDRGFKA
jgi:hypothetical protein